jgi:hypothetical protein
MIIGFCGSLIDNLIPKETILARMSNREWKERYFARCIANLSIYRPECKGQFMCPVCQKMLSLNDLGSKICIAHAPPEAVNGKPVTLACTDCEKRSSKWDRQVKYEKDMFDRSEKKVVKNITFVSESGTRLPCDLKLNEKDPNKIIARSTLPLDQLQKVSKKMEADRASDGTLNLFLDTTKFQKKDLNSYVASHLYSAFLIMFSRFGYEYALSSNVEDIRRVLVGEENAEKYAHAIITTHDKTPLESISSPTVSIQTAPKDLQCFIVEIPSPRIRDASRIIALPGFGESAKQSYENLMNKAYVTGIHFTKARINNAMLIRMLADPNSKGFGENLWKEVTLNLP